MFNFFRTVYRHFYSFSFKSSKYFLHCKNLGACHNDFLTQVELFSTHRRGEAVDSYLFTRIFASKWKTTKIKIRLFPLVELLSITPHRTGCAGGVMDKKNSTRLGSTLLNFSDRTRTGVSAWYGSRPRHEGISMFWKCVLTLNSIRAIICTSQTISTVTLAENFRFLVYERKC